MTVVVATGQSIDGVLNATKSVQPNSEGYFEMGDGGNWESWGFSTGGGGGGAVSSVAGQTGDITASSLATAVATQPALAGTYAPLTEIAKNPEQIATGARTYGTSLGLNGQPTAFAVLWPDGSTGAYAGTESSTLPGAVDTYTVTKVKSGTTTTFTQPAVTRDATTGTVTTRPAIVVS